MTATSSAQAAGLVQVPNTLLAANTCEKHNEDCKESTYTLCTSLAQENGYDKKIKAVALLSVVLRTNLEPEMCFLYSMAGGVSGHSGKFCLEDFLLA